MGVVSVVAGRGCCSTITVFDAGLSTMAKALVGGGVGNGGGLEPSFLAVAAFLRFAMIDSIILCSFQVVYVDYEDGQ